MHKFTSLVRIVTLFILAFYFAPTPVAHAQLTPEVEVEYVDASGVRQLTQVDNGVTTISGVAPFLVKFDASGTRAPTAFAAQSAITDPEAYAFLMVGYRINYGENRGGTWAYPAGTAFPRDEDTGPPVFSYVYTTPGSHDVQVKVRDTLGNEETVTFTVNVSSAPAATLIPASAGSWPTFVSGSRYTLEAGGDYRSFGNLETGGLHNIIFEKTGSGADPRIATFSPDGRSKFASVEAFEFRAAHIRLVNIDIEHFTEGQRGFDYVGIIGGLVQRFSGAPQRFTWHEGTEIMRSNVRYVRGFFLQDTELRSTAAGNGYIMFGTFNGFHARNTRFIHAENGPTTYSMLRVYGSNFTLRNNFWFSEVDGEGGNGTLISMLALDGPSPVVWRTDDTVGLISSSDNADVYGYISEKQILQNNQMYAEGSFLTNGISSVGGGNPSGVNLVYPRLMGWEDNYFFPAGNVARSIQNGELYGEYNFWRNNRRDMGQGSYIATITDAPNRNLGDFVTYNGPVLSEEANTRPVPTSFSATPAPVLTFGVSSSSIVEGTSTTLTWSTTNATSCTASNGWSGAQATASSTSVSPSVTTTYTLTCIGDGGSDEESVVVTVTAAPDPSQLVEAPYQNAAGYTVFTPSLDTQIIYVSSSEGNNSNDGLTELTPVQTIAYGKTLLRPDYPDWLLLKKGDTWFESLDGLSGGTVVAGRSPNEPALISSYGTGARPLLQINGGWAFGSLANAEVPDYVAIVGLEFYNAEKDPLSPSYDIDTEVSSAALLAGFNWFLIEDNVFRFVSVVLQGDSNDQLRNAQIRKNIFRDAFSVNSFSSCLFTAWTIDMLVEDNFFNNCGWNEDVPGAEASVFDRAAYLCCGDGNTVYRGNIDANGASGGVQLRSGGTIEDSLFLRSPVAISLGSGQNPTDANIPGLIRNNVILDARDINGDGRGFGIALGSFNALTDSEMGGRSWLENVEVYNNIISTNERGIGNSNAISVGGAGSILGLTIRDNIVYDWRDADLENNFGTALLFTSTGTSSENIFVSDNIFQQPRGGSLVTLYEYDPDNTTFSGNTYWSTSAEGTNYGNSWFTLPESFTNFTGWVTESGEVGAVRELVDFVDPDRSIDTYMTSIGIGGGYDEFINRASLQSRDTYDERFTSYAVNEYIRTGFAVAGAEPTPDPVITFGVSSSSITTGATTTLTWSTTNATSCTASNGWSGARATADSLIVSPGVTTTYTLTCVGDGGSDIESVMVTVTAAPDPTPAPVLTFGVSSSSIIAGNSTTLTWSTANATSCTASNGWSGARANSSSLLVSPSVTTTYTLTCTGAGGSDVESVVVTVTAAPSVTPPPSSSSGGGGGGGGGSRSSGGTTFSANERVYLMSTQVVRDLSRQVTLGTQATSTAGKIVSRTVRTRSGVTYYQVAFDSGLTGWVDRSSLSKSQLSLITTVQSPLVPPTSGQVRAVTELNIRVTPNGRIIGSEVAGSVGTIESLIKPETKDGYTWVYVLFDSGIGGFVAQDFLAAVVPPSSERDALLIAQIQLLIAEVQRLMLILAAMKGL